MEALIGLISGSGLLGGVFGFIQTWLETKKAEKEHAQVMERKRLEHSQRMEEIKQEAEMGYKQIELETQAQLAIAQENNRAQLENAQEATFRSSYQHDAAFQEGVSQWVRDGRAATRFLLTWFVIVFVVILGLYLAITSPTSAQAENYYTPLISFATMAFGWWFARRSKNPLDKK